MTIDIQVVLAMPDRQYRAELTVAVGTLAREAVKLALAADFASQGSIDIDPLTAPLGVFSELVDDNYALNDGDRVEIYRPLQQDPKELRRQRARRQ